MLRSRVAAWRVRVCLLVELYVFTVIEPERCCLGWLDKQTRKNPETGKPELYWAIQDRIKGQKIKRALGFVSEKEANRLLTIYEGEKARGNLQNVVAPKTSATDLNTPKIPTLKEWWGDCAAAWPDWPDCRMLQWLKASGFKPKTVRMYDSSRRLFLPVLGALRLDQIGPAEGDRLLVWMREQGYFPRTMQILMDHLRKGLQVAYEDRVLSYLPTLRRPRLTQTRPKKFLTPEDTGRLLRELENRVQSGIILPQTLLAIRLAVNLGLRSGEVMTRRWEDIDWQAGTLSIAPVQVGDTLWEPKTEVGSRVLPLPPLLLNTLREAWMQVGRIKGWMFPSQKHSNLPQGSFKRALASACTAAGVLELHPHALRHTAATRWMWLGMDRPTAMSIGGWKSSKMLDEVYAHTNQQRAAQQLATTEVEALPACEGQPDCPTTLPHNPQKQERPLVKSRRSR